MGNTSEQEFNEVFESIMRADEKTKEKIFKEIREERKKHLTFSFREVIDFLKVFKI